MYDFSWRRSRQKRAAKWASWSLLREQVQVTNTSSLAIPLSCQLPNARNVGLGMWQTTTSAELRYGHHRTQQAFRGNRKTVPVSEESWKSWAFITGLSKTNRSLKIVGWTYEYLDVNSVACEMALAISNRTFEMLRKIKHFETGSLDVRCFSHSNGWYCSQWGLTAMLRQWTPLIEDSANARVP